MRLYVAHRYGYRVWIDTLKRSGYSVTQKYELDEVYPDEELALLANTAAQLTETPRHEFLEGFGKALAPDLMRVYCYLIEPRWTYTDFLLNLEPLLHRVLELHTSNLQPTRLHGLRDGPDSVRLTYTSPLKACAAVKGLILGAAREYDVTASVEQPRCALRGDPDCVFEVRIARLESSAHA